MWLIIEQAGRQKTDIGIFDGGLIVGQAVNFPLRISSIRFFVPVAKKYLHDQKLRFTWFLTSHQLSIEERSFLKMAVRSAALAREHRAAWKPRPLS